MPQHPLGRGDPTGSRRRIAGMRQQVLEATIPSGYSLAMQSERSLTERMRAGEAGALDELYAATSRRAFGLAMRILGDEGAAADVVQEAYVSVWQRASLLDDGRGRVESLVLTITHNRAVDALRSRVRRGERVSSDAFDVMDETAAGEFDEIVERLSSQDVTAALGELPSEQRAVVDCAFFEGLTQTEIAARLAVPLGTVKSRLRLAMEKLRAALGGERPC